MKLFYLTGMAARTITFRTYKGSTKMKKLLITLYLLNIQFSFSQLIKVWEIDSICRGAECVVYDNNRNCLYVSDFNKFPGDGSNYNDDCITKIGVNGKVLEKNFIAIPSLTNNKVTGYKYMH